MDSTRFWLLDWEKQAIIDFAGEHPLDGYRRLTYMMIDADVVAVSPSSTYRVLKTVGLLGRWNGKPSKNGQGFTQPCQPHAHWHVHISYLNTCLPRGGAGTQTGWTRQAGVWGSSCLDSPAPPRRPVLINRMA